MSRVRIYDLAKELKPEHKKIFEAARRMGILSRAPYGFGASSRFPLHPSLSAVDGVSIEGK